MDSGFGDDEAYNVYDKPWRSDKDAASHIYRPSRNKDNDTYGDDLDELIKTNRLDVFLKAFSWLVLCSFAWLFNDIAIVLCLYSHKKSMRNIITFFFCKVNNWNVDCFVLYWRFLPKICLNITEWKQVRTTVLLFWAELLYHLIRLQFKIFNSKLYIFQTNL